MGRAGGSLRTLVARALLERASMHLRSTFLLLLASGCGAHVADDHSHDIVPIPEDRWCESVAHVECASVVPCCAAVGVEALGVDARPVASEHRGDARATRGACVTQLRPRGRMERHGLPLLDQRGRPTLCGDREVTAEGEKSPAGDERADDEDVLHVARLEEVPLREVADLVADELEVGRGEAPRTESDIEGGQQRRASAALARELFVRRDGRDGDRPSIGDLPESDERRVGADAVEVDRAQDAVHPRRVVGLEGVDRVGDSTQTGRLGLPHRHEMLPRAVLADTWCNESDQRTEPRDSRSSGGAQRK
ncbi:MAG: hypothetical protein JNL79_36925 [Myxococcales bacterium]|nr:hypothetical protein [Myxococcales bacterium]